MYEWEYLAKLLKKGYPLLDSLHILQKDSEEMKAQLQQGKDIKDCLLCYASPHLQQHLIFFLTVTSLAEAIICSLHMVNFESEMKKKIKKETAYPIFIFVFAYVTLFFFIQFVIPQLLLSFPLDTLDIFFTISIYFLKTLCALIGLFFLLLACLWIVSKRKGISTIFTKKMMKITVCKEYISYLFSSYLCELEKEGLSTRKAVSYLVHMPSNPMFSIFIKDLQQRMEKGEELTALIRQHSHLCRMFQTNFLIGVKTGTLVELLEDYLSFQEERWIIQLHRLSSIIQAISYSFVGILVIMVYQILLVPLQLLETM